MQDGTHPAHAREWSVFSALDAATVRRCRVALTHAVLTTGILIKTSVALQGVTAAQFTAEVAYQFKVADIFELATLPHPPHLHTTL